MYNPIISSGVLGWLAAQIIKTVLHSVKSDKLVMKRLVGAGGMPSSHTAMVIAALITLGRIEGVTVPIFGVAFIFSAIVIYDAMSVRRAAGLHAKELNVINKIIFKIKDDEDDTDSKDNKELNEYLGHTPFEVIGGAVVGVIIALLVPLK